MLLYIKTLLNSKFKLPKAGLLNKSSCLAPALGVTAFIAVNGIFWSHFVVLLRCSTNPPVGAWYRIGENLRVVSAE